MADLPIARPFSEKYYSIRPYKKQLRTSMESGFVISRAAHTRSRRTFTIGWDALPKTDFITFVEFFESTIGTSFNITDPLTGDIKTVRFTSDTLPQAKTSGWIFNYTISELEIAMDTGAIEVEEI